MAVVIEMVRIAVDPPGAPTGESAPTDVLRYRIAIITLVAKIMHIGIYCASTQNGAPHFSNMNAKAVLCYGAIAAFLLA